jgi:hypothetical protein
VHDTVRPDRERRGTSSEACLRRKLYRVLSWSEQQRTSGVATISNAGSCLGTLLLAAGRVCLAIPAAKWAPPGAELLDPTLAQLVSRSDAEGSFSAAARRAGAGALALARASLLRVAAANLVSMLDSAEEQSLDATLRPAADSYEHALTFSPAELCVASFGAALAPVADLNLALLGAGTRLLVLVPGREEQELPYPIVARGIETLTLRELFQLGRVAFELCTPGLYADRPRADLQVVSTSDDQEVWHYVRGPQRLVAICTSRALADAALSWAILTVAV